MVKKLYRTENDQRMLGGVCGGVAEFYSLDPSLVRLGFAIATLLGGSGLILYVLMWVIVPEKSKVS